MNTYQYCIYFYSAEVDPRSVLGTVSNPPVTGLERLGDHTGVVSAESADEAARSVAESRIAEDCEVVSIRSGNPPESPIGERVEVSSPTYGDIRINLTPYQERVAPVWEETVLNGGMPFAEERRFSANARSEMYRQSVGVLPRFNSVEEAEQGLPVEEGEERRFLLRAHPPGSYVVCRAYLRRGAWEHSELYDLTSSEVESVRQRAIYDLGRAALNGDL